MKTMQNTLSNNKSTRLCIICARGGSKGLKNKNTKLFLGKPLIAHTVQQAIMAKVFDVVAISSDDQSILDIAKDYGADMLIKRPDDLASDTAPKTPVLNHALELAEEKYGHPFDVIVDLQPTSPLRSPADISKAIAMLDANATNVISVCQAKSSPYYNLIEKDQKGEVRLCKPLESSLSRRQDSPRCYELNGSIYVWSRDSLIQGKGVISSKTALYEMPPEYSVDIDTQLDFDVAEFIANQYQLLS